MCSDCGVRAGDGALPAGGKSGLPNQRGTRGTASVLIDELERLGYLERKRSAEDKRSVMLSLTQKGKKVLVRDPVNVLVDAIAALDDDGKIRLRDTLRHILDQSDVAGPVATQILAIRMNTQMIRWYWAGSLTALWR